jgi:hypothetical protein
VIAGALGVDGDDNALAAEHCRRFADEIGAIYRAGIDRNFIGARSQERADISEIVDSSPDGQGHENLLGRTGYDVEHDAAVFMGCRDVEETELIGPFTVVDACDLNRVSGVA